MGQSQPFTIKDGVLLFIIILTWIWNSRLKLNSRVAFEFYSGEKRERLLKA